ncbi:MAG: hypothetical protein ACLFTA_03830, partial [Candidatus Nanohaloarchaea archaeon]
MVKSVTVLLAAFLVLSGLAVAQAQDSEPEVETQQAPGEDLENETYEDSVNDSEELEEMNRDELIEEVQRLRKQVEMLREQVADRGDLEEDEEAPDPPEG